MRAFLFGIVFTLAVACAGGYYGVKSGKLPLAADAQPSALERQIAGAALDEYVAQNAPKQQNPKAADATTLSTGARAYEENCAGCHGGAALRVNAMAKSFYPPIPQFLEHHAMDDPDGQIFFVVKHGIRWTAMPAWSRNLSDDQIWTIVAFLKHMNNLPPEAQAAWQQAGAKLSTGGADTQSQPGSASQPAPPH